MLLNQFIIILLCLSSVAGGEEVEKIVVARTNKIVKDETPVSISTSSPKVLPIASPDSSLPQSKDIVKLENLPEPSKTPISITSSTTNSDSTLPNISPLHQTTIPVETNVSKITAAQPLSTAKNETSKAITHDFGGSATPSTTSACTSFSNRKTQKEDGLSDNGNVSQQPPPIPKAPPLPPPPKPEAKVKIARPNDAARAASQRKKEEADRQRKNQGLIQELKVKGSRENLRKAPVKLEKPASIESPASVLRNSLKPRARAPSSSSAQPEEARMMPGRAVQLKSTADRSTRLEPLNEEETDEDDPMPGQVEIPGRQRLRNTTTPSKTEKGVGAKESTDISALRKGLKPASSRASLRPSAPETSAMSHLPSRQNLRNLSVTPSQLEASPGSETPGNNDEDSKSNAYLLRRRSSLRPSSSRPPKPVSTTPDVNTAPGQQILRKTSMATLRSERTDNSVSTNDISSLRAGLKSASSRPNLKSPSPETPAMRSIPSQQNLKRSSQRLPSKSETGDAQKSAQDISGLRGKLKPAASRASLRSPLTENSDTPKAANSLQSGRSSLKAVQKSAPETPSTPSSDIPEKSTGRAVQLKKTSVNQNRHSESPSEVPNFRGRLKPVAEGSESERQVDNMTNAGGTDIRKLKKSSITEAGRNSIVATPKEEKMSERE